MGTNYYLERDCCDKCKRKDTYHIGKNSCGWYFTFHTQEALGLESFMSFICTFRERRDRIINEYDEEISLEEFIEIVVMAKHQKNVQRNATAKSTYLCDEWNTDFS